MMESDVDSSAVPEIMSKEVMIVSKLSDTESAVALRVSKLLDIFAEMLAT